MTNVLFFMPVFVFRFFLFGRNVVEVLHLFLYISIASLSTINQPSLVVWHCFSQFAVWFHEPTNSQTR